MKNNYVSELFNLKDKVAVVIGAGGFLCGEMAIGLAQAGVSVALLDKNKKNINLFEKKIKKINTKVLSVCVDVTEKQDLENAKIEVLKKFKKIDILINGAGINAPTPVMDIKKEEWSAIIDSHVTATLFGCQVFGAEMIKRKKGSIINMSSASSGPPLSKAFSYSVAKAGVKNLTQNLGREWATYNVRVNALKPGFFPTNWSMKHFITKQRENAILGHTAMKRYGKPKELVGAVLWLASDAASFVTGSEVTIDGGFSCMTI
ncbi:MAG: SDR family oxidoreductase [Candidatus Zapsychrus exili]|nr:SDR family oxidoreductase [Candidatus Zapsychrus exili]